MPKTINKQTAVKMMIGVSPPVTVQHLNWTPGTWVNLSTNSTLRFGRSFLYLKEPNHEAYCPWSSSSSEKIYCQFVQTQRNEHVQKSQQVCTTKQMFMLLRLLQIPKSHSTKSALSSTSNQIYFFSPGTIQCGADLVAKLSSKAAPRCRALRTFETLLQVLQRRVAGGCLPFLT